MRFVFLLPLAVLLSGCAMVAKPGAEPNPGIEKGKSATFEARHEFTFEVPEGAAMLRAWLPMPSPNDQYQDITQWEVESPWETTVVEDNWENSFLHIQAVSPRPGRHTVVTKFRIIRHEVQTDLDPSKTRPHTLGEQTELARWTASTSQSPITSEIVTMASDAVGMEPNPLVAHRKIFDAVLDHVEHHAKDPNPDESVATKASGRGSSEVCFASSTGGCADIHSLYAACARSLALPVRVVYGSFFKRPLDGQDQDQSYHCWLEFHAPNLGWIPLDVAVADIYAGDFEANEHSRPRVNLAVGNGYDGPNAATVDYYFGNLDERRVSWHWGRDLVLGQTGDPLIWNPTGHAEVDDTAIAIERKLTFSEVD